MNIITKRRWFFALSGLVLVPGLIALALFGLKFSIDFTGGSKLLIDPSQDSILQRNTIEDIYKKEGIEIHNIVEQGNEILIRSIPMSQKKHEKVFDELAKKDLGVKENSFETVGAVIGNETKTNAIKAVVISIIAITLYVAFAFRAVSQPVASWKFGIVTIITLAHDILVTVGIFAILGKVFQVEVDSLFITALLTILGFSVHDTIVVFDRIRENLKKNSSGGSFDIIVNNSILETANRSFNTSVTVIFVLSALLFFSEGPIFWFVIALLIGIISGVYSSVFTAAPLLVEWYEWDKKHKKKK
ncbi:MAG: protein translocase subunit SecF [Candidatus Levybacteria bacterium]|nr:protein translocase subunit SecF [Candidatus Levybacteria bacterium]